MSDGMLGPYVLNTIVTGDARELAQAIPDESVDLIFTDPVYDRIDDYRWLAETAARVLKPDSAALVWQGTTREFDARQALETNLRHRLTLNYIVTGNGAFLNNTNIFAWRSPCIWMSNGNNKPNYWIPDTVVSGKSTANGFKWNKNPEPFIEWVQAFSKLDGVVFDPFTGGGTVPAVCKMLGRNYLAFEIDPATAELARERVANTQPPLFTVQHEQLEFNP